MPSLRTKFIVALAAFATACNALGGGSSAPGRRGDPLELERLQFGSVYGIGSRFESDGLRFTVEGFGEGLGNAEVGHAGAAAKPAKAGAKSAGEDAGKSILLSHALLRCTGRSATHLEFDFVDRGGPVALEIAGTRKDAADFIALDGVQLGNVRLAVQQSSTAGVRSGRVSAEGKLDQFAIGGAELELVDVRLYGN